MPESDSVSAVVVRVTVPPAIDRLRRRWDTSTALGVPAHVTILFPFLPASALTGQVHRQLAVIAARVQPFDVRFATVGRFPDALYLAPDPARPFIELTRAVAATFPDHPPYSGAFDDVVPHLTVADAPTAPMGELERLIRPILPIQHRVTALDVLVDDRLRRWRRHWRIPLGVRP
jgi:2'-5' RNA ligase